MNFWTQLKKPFFVLAPMENVTDTVFRQVVASCGKPDVFFTEFTNVEGMFSKGAERVMMRLEQTNVEHPLVAQIWGRSPENFRKAAAVLADRGFDGIDLNMGCPDKSVVHGGAGSGLIANPSLAAEMIQATKEGAKGLPVSVKTRIGLKRVQTEEWLGHLLQQQVAVLTVHGRTAKEMSKVPAHWDEIAKAVQLRDAIGSETLIVGNGDVESRQEGAGKAQQYGVDGIMIGRGIFKNIWFFHEQPTGHSLEENLEKLLEHARLFQAKWGDEKDFFILRKFFKAYVKDFDNASEVREQLMQTRSLAEVEAIVVPHLAPHASLAKTTQLV